MPNEYDAIPENWQDEDPNEDDYGLSDEDHRAVRNYLVCSAVWYLKLWVDDLHPRIKAGEKLRQVWTPDPKDPTKNLRVYPEWSLCHKAYIALRLLFVGPRKRKGPVAAKTYDETLETWAHQKQDFQEHLYGALERNTNPKSKRYLCRKGKGVDPAVYALVLQYQEIHSIYRQKEEDQVQRKREYDKKHRNDPAKVKARAKYEVTPEAKAKRAARVKARRAAKAAKKEPKQDVRSNVVSLNAHRIAHKEVSRAS